MVTTSCPVIAYASEIPDTSTNTSTVEDLMQIGAKYEGNWSSVSPLEYTEYFTKRNGATLNFYIENLGKSNVTITINGKGARTFAPGESGHISTSVVYFRTKYVFQASDADGIGNTVNINWVIAQRK